MTKNLRLRICIDARAVSPEMPGGTVQFAIGLASGLSQLKDGPEEYFFLTYEERTAWLEPYISPPCRIETTPLPGRIKLAQSLGPAEALARRVYKSLRATIQSNGEEIPSSGGSIERLKANLVHFTNQSAFSCSIPNIYHPHDLQHLHLPECFTPNQRLLREQRYREFCKRASIVAVASSWTKSDVIQHYGLPDEKVVVVPLAPPTDCYPMPSDNDLEEVRAQFRLPPKFIFYPAQTWPHKNHIALLEALAELRDQQGIVVPFVSVGKRNEYFNKIKAHIDRMNLESQVQFLGFVNPLQLQCLYRLCRATIIPTKFEAASFPCFEAAMAGSPVACSNVTSLPEQVGDSAIIFDPYDVNAIAEAVSQLWQDDALCTLLINRARQRVASFSWARTAQHFRALYRRLCGLPLSRQDSDLLSSPPIL